MEWLWSCLKNCLLLVGNKLCQTLLTTIMLCWHCCDSLMVTYSPPRLLCFLHNYMAAVAFDRRHVHFWENEPNESLGTSQGICWYTACDVKSFAWSIGDTNSTFLSVFSYSDLIRSESTVSGEMIISAFVLSRLGNDFTLFFGFRLRPCFSLGRKMK